MNKYSNVLTFALIIIIVLVLGILGYFGYDMYVSEKTETKAQLALEEFEESVKKVEKKKVENKVENTIVNEVTEPTNNVNAQDIINQLNSGEQTVPEQTEDKPKEAEKTYLEGYEILGTLTFNKSKISYPVLNEVTKKSLESSIAVLYPPNTPLNQPGNTVIVGHNYRNGKFFSNNKKLEIGDTIDIKDATGTTITYEIYNKYFTTPDDADYMKRDTNGAREISLSTCTDDSTGRLIIWAKEK